MIPCAPVEWRQPAEAPAALQQAPAPSSAPGYAAALKPSRWGWITLPRWCVWVEPGANDRWAQRWSTAVNSALREWGQHLELVRVSDANAAHLRLWRRRPPRQNGRASNGRAYLSLQQVQRQGQSGPRLEPQVELLLSPGLRLQTLQATALHELGHGFGLWGHSDQASDVMALHQGPQPRLELSGRDLQTLRWLQQQPSGVGAGGSAVEPGQTAAPAPAPPSGPTAD